MKIGHYEIIITNGKESLKFDPSLFEKVTGIKIENSEIEKILNKLGFEVKEIEKSFELKIPTWRPDIFQSIDVVEELVRIKGYDKIKLIEIHRNDLLFGIAFF